MSQITNKLQKFWLELKRRRVIHVIVVYATAAIVIIELINNVFEPLKLPVWTPTMVIIILAIGFPFAIIFSWIFNISTRGIKKADKATEQDIPKDKDSASDRVSHFENSIAVLPFQDMSPKKDQEYFCDGMTEEIINVLTHVEDLKVIARTSSFMYKDKHEDMRTIGNELGVAHLLEGSIRKADNRLRITAQLIKVTDGTHLWSEKFDREKDDVFAIQDEISIAIVDHLKTKLLISKKDTSLKRHPKKSEIYNLYLLGRFYTNKRNTESLNKAIEYYEEAIQMDPEYALPYAGLSEAYALIALGYGALPSKEAYPKSMEAALKAIDLDEELVEAHTSLAFVKQYFELDWPGVEKGFKRAIQLNPGYAPAHQWYGEYLFMNKKWDEAYREIQLAIELDPLSYIIRNELGWFYHYQKKLDLAIEEYKKVIEMAPDYAVVHFNLGTAYSIKGMHIEALENAEKAVKLSGGSPFMKAGLAYAFALAGKKESAEAIRDEMIDLVRSGHMYQAALATVYVALKEKDKAIKCLEAVYENKEAMMFLFRTYYEDYLCSDFLSDDPWFNEIQQKLGLE